MPQLGPALVNAAVLVMDAVRSVEIARVYGPLECDRVFIRPLQETFRSVLASVGVVPQAPPPVV